LNVVTLNPIFTIRTLDPHNTAHAAIIDGYVSENSSSTVFHRTAWGRAVQKGCGHKTLYLIAEDGEGTVAGLMPLTHVQSPLFGSALVSSGFAVGGGVLSDNGAASKMLIAAAIAHAKEIECPGIELRGGNLPQGWQEDHDSYVGFARSLAGDDEAELLTIPRKQRAEVRKGLSYDLTIETGTSARDRDAHYQVYATSVRNLGTPVFPKGLFKAVLDEFGADADILTVRHDGSAIASVLSLYHNGTVMPYWGGGTADARTWRANDVMYYALMCHARSVKACKAFDFGRSKVGTGPAAFKKNWGFEAVPLSYAKWSADGQPARDINPLNPKYRMKVALWQKLPLWVANRVGPFIAKGLG
jgi:FemAB-related protein (PEP-CTERM system-associated)